MASGKGGVGKTNVAVNLALSLRLFGREVLLVDADMGLANVDILLGLRPQYDLRDVILDGRPFEDVVLKGPRGLEILPGASGIEEMAQLSPQEVERFLGELERYCAGKDFVVVDSAPGLSSQVINCLLAADEVLLVTNPEPTALTDAYALLKVLSTKPDARGKAVHVIVNQAGSREEAVLSFDRIRNAAKHFLNWDVTYLGSVARDPSVSQASKEQVDFLTHYSASPCSRDVRKIAARLLSAEGKSATSMCRFFRAMLEETADE